MLRKREQNGWTLITHPDHAGLAGAFASQWGNEFFTFPEPRDGVLEAIYRHDDGWKERDAAPQVTRKGLPSAFSTELVGKYSAFEEIDLADYLAVRGRALENIAQRNPYAAILISMHTHNLLAERSDRSTIHPNDLPLLDKFLADQRAAQARLRKQLEREGKYPAAQISTDAFHERFCLLQACDSLSLLACVDFDQPADLLHNLPTKNGRREKIVYKRKDNGLYALDPYPFAASPQVFTLPGRRIAGDTFTTEELGRLYHAAPIEERQLTFTAL
jgi:hypothetical protein